MANPIRLNQDLILKEIEDYFIEIYENIDEDKQESFKVIFEDLDRIQNLISLENVTVKDIKWFFSLDLFYVLSDDEEEENRVLLNEIYNLLLSFSIIEECKDVQNHANVLLEHAETVEDKGSYFLEEFFPILECALPLTLKRSLNEIIELKPYKEKID